MQYRATHQDQIGLQLEMFGNTLPSGANLTGDVFRVVDGANRQPGRAMDVRDDVATRPFSTTAISKPVQRRCAEQYTRANR